MAHRLLVISFSLMVFFPSAGLGVDQDVLLRKIVAVNNIRPLETKPLEKTPKYRLGQALFFDPILSGNRDISCATCHVLSLSTSDGLPMSIGPGGTGLGPNRKSDQNDIVHPRNALDLWNRDNSTVTSMFWDGRVEQFTPNSGQFRTPMRTLLPDGLQNLLAVQALFPVVMKDEMLGRSTRSDVTGSTNELAQDTMHLDGPQRFARIHDLIMNRLIGAGGEPNTEIHNTYLELFRSAYLGHQGSFTIVHAVNAIAHFEEFAFSTRDAAWDRYLRGDGDAISSSAKEGAIMFFGRGRCFVCHSGPLFSDFQFHAIGVRRIDSDHERVRDDLGRFAVTEDDQDKYKFRTPPLRNVSITAPYFHNGTSHSLADALMQHIDPYRSAGEYLPSGEYAMNPEQINAISPIVASKTFLTDDEIGRLIDFLKTLEDSAEKYRSEIIPTSVPSGLMID